jgi:hypothetical protein
MLAEVHSGVQFWTPAVILAAVVVAIVMVVVPSVGHIEAGSRMILSAFIADCWRHARLAPGYAKSTTMAATV